MQFETIHPFLDGNGRVGRLLITFLLTERGVLHKPVLYLSHYLKQHRQTYYEHLQAVRDQGAWEAWPAFFLRGVIEVAGEAVIPKNDGSCNCENSTVARSPRNSAARPVTATRCSNRCSTGRSSP